MCLGACAIRPHSIAPVYLLEIHSLQFLNWHLTIFDSMETNNNELYVLYFAPILHSFVRPEYTFQIYQFCCNLDLIY